MDKLVDLLNNITYYKDHTDEIHLGTTKNEQLFSMFIRDPRCGLGMKDLGRELMRMTDVPCYYIVRAGRFDDLFYKPTMADYNFMLSELMMGNELAKKWMPRLKSKNKDIAKDFCHIFQMSEKEYRNYIKCETTKEYKMSYCDEKGNHPFRNDINGHKTHTVYFTPFRDVFLQSNLVNEELLKNILTEYESNIDII